MNMRSLFEAANAVECTWVPCYKNARRDENVKSDQKQKQKTNKAVKEKNLKDKRKDFLRF